MIYRPFGRTNIKLSRLGFGAMRLPLTNENDPAAIDEHEATKMLHYAIDQGVNYIDNAYPYHRQASEVFVGRALKGGYRHRVYLATKMPVWLVKSKGDPQKFFDEQRLRLNTDTIDMYLLHSLDKNSWETVKKYDILDFLDGMLQSGEIRFAGFSYHDELPLFKQIIDAYPWTLCLIHLNYVDDRHQAGLEGLEYAARKGVAVMIMEPMRGGKLANNVPKPVMDTIAQTGRKQTPAEFALRWVLNRSEVSCVLSGMSSMKQVAENVRFASEEHVDTLTPEELKLYAQARAFYHARTKVNCTQCGYCMPCAQGIPISFIMELYNDAVMYDAIGDSRWMYRMFIKPENNARVCTECGDCEEKCPQKIPIIEFLKEAHKVLS